MMAARQRVLVVGGGGFVGGAILRALAASPDWVGVAASRRPAPGAIGCDATDRAALQEAASGASVIVNAMAGSPGGMCAVAANVCGVAAAGGQRVVHLSSMAVYGAAEGWVDEAAPLDAAGSPYAAAKIACEATVDRFAAAGGVATILRPGIVYGPADQHWTGRLCRLLLAGRLGDLGEAGDGYCNLIHANDVAAAVLAALRLQAGGVFHLASPAPLRWNQVLGRLALAVGATPLRRIGARRLTTEGRVAAVPLQLAKLAAVRARLPAGAFPEPIPRSLLALFAQQIRLDPRRADTLGFGRTDDAAGLADAAGWFRRSRPA